MLRELAKLISEANGFGALHIVIEDENVDDDNLEFCRHQPEITADELRILDLLQPLTERQREAIIVLADLIAVEPTS
jgi:hypothetical protein